MYLFCCFEVPERGSLSRSGTAGTTGIGLPDTLLAGQHAAGHRPALRFGSGARLGQTRPTSVRHPG